MRIRLVVAALIGLSALSACGHHATYEGGRWHLASVTGAGGTTSIPPSIDAWLELPADGRLQASDDVNSYSANFKVAGDGFDTSDSTASLVGYAGHDPVQEAATAAIQAVTTGTSPVHVTVRSADAERLQLQAGDLQLAFVRTMPSVSATP